MKRISPISAMAFAVAAVLVSGCQAFHVKTPQEIKEEVRTKMVQDMRARGLSEDEINQTITYIDMPYKQQLETVIRSSSSPTENFIRLMDKSHESCEFKKSMVSLPAVSSIDISNRKQEVVSCAIDSKSVVSRYYNTALKNGTADADKSDLTDIYLQWLSYMDSLSKSTSNILSDSLSADYKASSRKYTIKRGIW